MRTPPKMVVAAAALVTTFTCCAGDRAPATLDAAAPEVAAVHVPGTDKAGLHLETTTTTTTPPTTTTTTPPPTTAAPTTTAAPPPPPPPPPPPTTAPPPPPAVTTASGAEGQLMAMLNQDRAAAGLAPLGMRDGARSVARAWSSHMAGSGLNHNPNLTGDLAAYGITNWRTVGENVGYAGSVAEVHQLFMASAGHRANILKAGYSEVGVGIVESGGRVWVTTDFVGY